MSDNNSKRKASTGFLTTLVLIFVILKLVGKITWSWWWVFAPWWMPIAIVLLVLGIVTLIEKVSK